MIMLHTLAEIEKAEAIKKLIELKGWNVSFAAQL